MSERAISPLPLNAPPTLETAVPTARKVMDGGIGTVLFAEDNDDLRDVTNYFLTLEGFKVIACPDGDQAAAAFSRVDTVDMLLTDFDMPGRSGLELARDLTALCPGLPVVIVSGSIMSDRQLSEIEQYRWIFLSKPCKLPVLLATCQFALRPLPPCAT